MCADLYGVANYKQVHEGVSRDNMSKGFPFIPFLQVKGYSLQWNQSDRHVEAYPGFRALDGMLAH